MLTGKCARIPRFDTLADRAFLAYERENMLEDRGVTP